ncbi:hypothetical protein [Nonomuraea insulae]|uniref:HTH IS21-type domain-containing protein n=1 Tax=Nonomuraea insulae TaxID=1616787 RepID=A0ABW1DBH2_9ACTN
MSRSMSKVELFAAIRRESRAGLSGRQIAMKYRVSRNTVALALKQVWPEQRKTMKPRATRLDPYKILIDQMLRADLDAPRKQRHTVKRIFDRLLSEHNAVEVSYQMVRAYADEDRFELVKGTGLEYATIGDGDDYAVRDVEHPGDIRRPGDDWRKPSTLL